ncbi:MspA family porin [Mycobacterium sp. CBMA293]|uniref:MspA family porin n=1 Tax=unclassified Mycolicibacterium TaxID=2636767 RepID=UPI0012DC6C5C|nr:MULTISPECIES: MspA family porin [unclassified Mycolicibacterium]MUL48911.1 MspA family porin [Mycolicibacterium sp. CBMA 360]MUL62522.1 MspA family porin [Mycolicibacterium sp. CBMA 335]MUL74213.1 MspA family porin [Mycolicibacterium sp. CBMA 311]MUL96907.1 MspA family porin [Mycolicibacterium sp. CBMA 230]MUM03955.1 MspA family protein [Mycolicibacterium sp. CBMA 213]
MTALCVTAGVIATGTAVAPASAHADSMQMAPQVYDKVTRDGWHLQIKIDNESINSVPNLAAAANSREGFVTASGTATVTGGSAPITDSIFILGYQLGCQSDVSTGLQLGGTAGAAGSAGLPLTGVSGTIGAAGFVQTVVQPGVIVDLPLANMSLSDSGQAMLDIDNIHIKADACGGDVNIRSYAYLRVSTAKEHTEFAIYGDPTKI